ncbi:ATP-binding cassette sub-family G member 1-like [Anopheles darlingi]|uniref:ATP-binding cassette sub-family G member 1-like n=1 Tax=Anopheles darlingi TaxID=43151 RepID=UPI0021001B9A|nr:ATP-binding cassette sub-family G member 1-like [Anopheles darlingi]
MSENVEITIPLVQRETNLVFKSISYSIGQRKKEKQLLKNISGKFRSGRLTAILGPSGAGKTTLLNVLSGFKTQGVSGNIVINNEVIDRHRYRQLVAYTAQDVALLPNITPRENLHYAADLKLPKEIGEQKKITTVNDVIAVLGLQKCADTRAQMLSGGEKKRLSIGMELVSNPQIMFFDEPTSGLDSVASYQVISYMKDLAQQGRCVVSVIHQPSSELLELFDDVYVVVDGRCLYQGSLDNLITTFAEAGFQCPPYYNRADFVLKIASKYDQQNVEIEEMITASEKLMYTEMDHGKSRTATSNAFLADDGHFSQYPISWWDQFSILTRRTTLGTVRNPALMGLRLFGHILIGFTIGFVFSNVGADASKVLSNISFMILVLMFIIFANAMTVVLTFPLEMVVFIREHKSNYYSVSAYYFSKLVADFPWMITGVTAYLLIVYYLSGQLFQIDRIIMFWGICALFGWLSQLYGLIAGCIFSIELSPVIVPVSMLPALLFSGFFIRYNELTDVFKPLPMISYFRYGFEGLVQATYGHNRTELDCAEIFCYYRKTNKILDELHMVPDRYWTDVLGLSIWIVFLHVVLYFSLRYRIRLNH